MEQKFDYNNSIVYPLLIILICAFLFFECYLILWNIRIDESSNNYSMFEFIWNVLLLVFFFASALYYIKASYVVIDLDEIRIDRFLNMKWISIEIRNIDEIYTEEGYTCIICNDGSIQYIDHRKMTRSTLDKLHKQLMDI